MFNYKCEECKEGMVRPQKVKNYKTQFYGYPFSVKEAIIGICDTCRAQYFNAKERKRWRKLYEKNLEADNKLLTPEEIKQLRNQSGLSIEAFANLIGCTRQSIYNWERVDRIAPQSKTADLLMRLVRKSYTLGRVDVLEFLTSEAGKMGVKICPKKSDPKRRKSAIREITDDYKLGNIMLASPEGLNQNLIIEGVIGREDIDPM